jgi:hypothetical protein
MEDMMKLLQVAFVGIFGLIRHIRPVADIPHGAACAGAPIGPASCGFVAVFCRLAAPVCHSSHFPQCGEPLAVHLFHHFERSVTMFGFLLWLLLLFLCWPLALLALLLYPVFWLLLLPFRLVGISVEAVFSLLRAVLMLPARVLGLSPGRQR